MHPISTLSAAEHAALYALAKQEAHRLRREAMAGTAGAAWEAMRAALRRPPDARRVAAPGLRGC
jgi:hypothetical protein